jgi:hypothetical protein
MALNRGAGIPVRVLPRSRLKILIAGLLLALPPVLFYAILFREAVNLPFQDDYEALLDFLNQMADLPGISAKVSYFLASQFNEYKLFFGHGLAWLQFALMGHVGITLLCAVGNAFVLLLAALLWKMFIPHQTNLAHRMAFFIPVSWLLFQLQYVETLNWAMPSLANFPVLVFSLGAIYLLVRGTQSTFWGAILCLILAIGSTGNGLLMIPIGLLILLVDRRYKRAVSWLAGSAGCVAAYAYHYHVMRAHNEVHHTVLSVMLRPFYVIAFIGNIAAFPIGGRYFPLEIFLAILLGVLVCIFFAVMARRGYLCRNRLVSYCVLFLLLTAVGVAGLRSSLGVRQSLDSRYGIYSTLFLIFAWFIIVEEFLQYETVPLRRNQILLVAIAAAIVFSLTMDTWGRSYLSARDRIVILGMAAYDHPASPGQAAGPILPYPNQDPRLDELDRRAPGILRRSTQLGIYRPPIY